MAVRTAAAAWEGSVKEGHGTIYLGSGLFEAPYSFGSRFETGAGTNPEELVGAAAAGCFTMALSLTLSELGHAPTRIDTTARVSIAKTADGFRIPYVELRTDADVPGIDAETFAREAEQAKTDCPVSRALAGTEIRLEAHLTS
ncbi:MAG: OsmC family peroxiredoxin [Acidimicrobiales bacterium]